MGDRVRPYVFYDIALSICSTCFRKVEAKIVFQDGKVLMLKQCPQHGPERVLVADDIEYYKRCREVFIKPPEMPRVYNTPVKWGCPYDCGLHRSRAALVPLARRDHRPLQFALSDLLRRKRT
jgi:7,8-dihydro-6-hydroxymethylpterin dimethyltransferase